MFSFDVSEIEDTYLRPCVCAEETKNIPKTFCYVEGTDLDTSRSETKEELSENVWFEIKPPKLFCKEDRPLVTARQIEICRVILSGSRVGALPEEEKRKEKVVVNMRKKRSAVKFLSTTETCIKEN